MGVVARGKVDFEDHKPYTEPEYEGILSPDCLSFLTLRFDRRMTDCGLFVLFFMERFIEKAPERLKMKDLAMFGRQWFKPEEASGLRVKIRKILMLEFKKACDINCDSESSPFPKGDDPANIDHRSDSD